MGFSHYWERPIELDAKTFELWTKDIRKIIKQAEQDGIKIKGRSGKNVPIITDELVEFNGDDETGSAAENFYIARIKNEDDVRDKGSCKTGLEPYDAIVGAALVCLKYRFGSLVRINSDEGMLIDKNRLSKDGIVLAEKILGVKLVCVNGYLQDTNKKKNIMGKPIGKVDKTKFRDNKVSHLRIDDVPIWKHLKDDATKREAQLTNKDSGKFAEIIGGRILWNFRQSKILNDIFPDIEIMSANRMTGLGVGDVTYKISYKKNEGFGQRIVIFEIKHGRILLGRFQFEKYCRIISQPENYFPKADDVRVIFLMFEEIDTLNQKASYSYKELDKELAIKFLEQQKETL